MLNAIAERKTETFGVAETQDFRIKANGKAFKVLIDGLYSDKIRAVIRELWTNAYDSHAMAGKLDVPFHSHLPTKLEPWFGVRDYGVSMSHGTVMHLYTTVFESSKEDTNDQVGKLGLGSKSPFAYTDTFTITAWLDGEKRTYSAYIADKYIPRIALMSTEPSDEPTGIAISFPVKTHDISDFAFAAQRVAIGFDVLPTCNTPLYASERAVLFEGDGWRMFKGTEFNAHARQGCVVYPLDIHAITGLTAGHREMLNGSILIDFPIGDLEITASREGLGYDETTCANIVKRLNQITEQFRARVAGLAATCKSYMEMLDLLHANTAVLQLPLLVRNVLTTTKWRGKLVKMDYQFETARWRKRFPGVSVTAYRNYYLGKHTAPRKQAVIGDFSINRRNTLYYVISPGDVQKSQLERIQADRRNRNSNSDIVILNQWPDNAVTRLRVDLGRPSADCFINMRDVAKLPRVAGARAKTTPKRIVSGSEQKNWPDSGGTASGGGLYVAFCDGKPVGRALPVVLSILTLARRAGILSQTAEIHAIPKTLAHYYTNKKSNWVDVQAYILEKARLIVTKEVFLARQIADQQNIVADHDIRAVAQVLAECPQETVNLQDGMMQETVDYFRSVAPPQPPQGYAQALALLINYDGGVPADWVAQAPPPPYTLEQMTERYPMLAAACGGARSTDFNRDVAEVAINYVNLIDGVPKL